MLEVAGNIWTFHTQGNVIVIPTNGTVTRESRAVMGRGLALQTRYKYPRLPLALGRLLTSEGNSCYYFPEYKVITFPTKHEWWQESQLDLIVFSCGQLVGLLGRKPSIGSAYLPRVGCGFGGLSWKDVKPALQECLDDRFIVVTIPGEE
jgi:hypothetical protein